MAHAVSPLAPKTYAEPPAVAGVRFATAEAGIKYKNRTDVLLVAMDEGTVVAGVAIRAKSTGDGTSLMRGYDGERSTCE